MATGDQVPRDDGDGCKRNQYPASYMLNALEGWQVERCDQDHVANEIEYEHYRKRTFPAPHKVADAEVEVDQCRYDSEQDDADL